MLESANVAGDHVAHEIAQQAAVLDRSGKEDLKRKFLLALGHQLPRLLVERFEAVADETRLPTCGRGRLLLEDVLGPERVEPGRAVGLREHEAGDTSALGQHQRAGGDLGVVEGCAHASPPAASWT